MEPLLTLPPTLSAKRAQILRGLQAAVPQGRLAVAFSGGADSTLLLALASEALGTERVTAVTAVSESLPRRELAECRDLAEGLGVDYLELETRELERPGYVENSPNRCYHCKAELFEQIELSAVRERVRELGAVAYGAIADDLGDHRPGMRAAREHEILAPLAMAGLTKSEVRQLSRSLGLPTWDKPAHPCLASRIPYGQEVTAQKLGRIEQGEALLREIGCREGRVRHHQDGDQPWARIEVPLEFMPELLKAPAREKMVAGLRELGFAYVVLDLEGFRSGRLNEGLSGARRLPTA